MALRHLLSCSSLVWRDLLRVSSLPTSVQNEKPNLLKSDPMLPGFGFSRSNFLPKTNSALSTVERILGDTARAKRSIDSECRSRQKPWNCDDSRTAYAWFTCCVAHRLPRPDPPTALCAP